MCRDGQLKRSLPAAAARAHDRIRRLLVIAVAAAVVVVALGATTSYAASPGAPTRGDAQGIFQAFFSGGTAIRAHSHMAEGVPGVPVATTPDGARIYPNVDDAVYCDQGWHVVLLGWFDDLAFWPSNKDLFDWLASVDLRFVLDGVPLETQRSAIKRISTPDPAFLDSGFVVGFGAFLAPGALSVGTHELRTIVQDPVYGDVDFTTPFTVVSC